MPSSVTDALAMCPTSPSGLRWKYDTKRRKVGAVAGYQCADGYWTVCVKRHKYPAHHVVWFLTYGFWPERLDHIDGRRGHNVASNLRLATQGQNICNRQMPTRDLPQGVTRSRSGYRGCVQIHGVKHRATFPTIESALAWVLAKRDELHGEFACTRNSTGVRKALLSN